MSLRNRRLAAVALWIAALVPDAVIAADAPPSAPPPAQAYPMDMLPGHGDVGTDTAAYGLRDWYLRLKMHEATQRETYCKSQFADPVECANAGAKPSKDATTEPKSPPAAAAKAPPPPELGRITVKGLKGVAPDIEADIIVGNDIRRLTVHAKDRLPDGRRIKTITADGLNDGITLENGDVVRYHPGAR